MLLLLLAIGGAALAHAAGGGMAVIIIIAVIIAVLGLLILRFYPHLRRHFAPFGPRRRGMRRQRTTRTITRGQKGGQRRGLPGLGRGRTAGGGRAGGGLLGRKGRSGGAAGGRKGTSGGGSGRKGLARLNPFGRKGAGGAGSRSGRHRGGPPAVPGARGRRTLRHPFGGGRRGRAVPGSAASPRQARRQARRAARMTASGQPGRRSALGRRGGAVPGFPGGRPSMFRPGQRRQYRRAQKSQARQARAARQQAAAQQPAPANAVGRRRLRRTRAFGRFLRNPTAAGRQRTQARKLRRQNRKNAKAGGRQDRKDARLMAAEARRNQRNAQRAAAGGRWRHARRLSRQGIAWGRAQSRRGVRYAAPRVRSGARRAWGAVQPLAVYSRFSNWRATRAPLRSRAAAWAAGGSILAGSLLFWRRRRSARQAGPAYVVRPPSRRADPEDGRMPAPAASATRRPETVPYRTPAERAPLGGGGSMASPITRAAEDFSKAVSTWQPEGPGDMIGTFDGMPESMREMTSGVAGIVATMQDGMPTNPATKAAADEFLKMMSGLEPAAQELADMFRRDHQTEIDRVENPRPNEELWDVAREQ